METPLANKTSAHRHCKLLAAALGCMAILYAGMLAALPNPQERIDYWQQNFSELTADDDPRVAGAQHIFGRILQAAGTRYGVTPRLHIIKENPFNVVLPISIPDGWIILSKQVMDMCYENQEQGDDRLAFVLAHEIAHLLDDDFWHMNFFSALSLLKESRNLEQQKVVHEIQGIFAPDAKVKAKELRADERGILFSAMAGYDPFAIVNEQADQQGSFFHQWYRLLNIETYVQPDSSFTHPTSSQRSTAVLARLKQVSEQADLFKMGLILYQTGKFELAAKAFGEFLRYFPSREVYHNLAAAQHQIALNFYHADPEQTKQRLLPFYLPVMADPYTRAAFGVTRGNQKDRQAFATHMELAIKNYKLAIEQDANYLLAHQNLASAYLVNNEPYKAIAALQDIVTRTPPNAMLNNILGVGFYLTDNVDKAATLLNKAIVIDEGFAPAYYNLGKIAFLQGDKTKANAYWKKFMAAAPEHRWSQHLAANFNLPVAVSPKPEVMDAISKQPVSKQLEALAGVKIGLYLDELPVSLGKPRVKKFILSDSEHVLMEYPNGISIVAEGGEVRIITANEKYRAARARGENSSVHIGSSRNHVISNYGLPALQLDSTSGKNLLYPQEGVSFQLTDGKVVSWSIY